MDIIVVWFFIFHFLFLNKKYKIQNSTGLNCGENGVLLNEECACSSGYLGLTCDTFLGFFSLLLLLMLIVDY